MHAWLDWIVPGYSGQVISAVRYWWGSISSGRNEGCYAVWLFVVEVVVDAPLIELARGRSLNAGIIRVSGLDLWWYKGCVECGLIFPGHSVP